MDSVVESRRSGRWVVAAIAFAAYAVFSAGMGWVAGLLAEDLAPVMYVQALVYLLVAGALWRRVGWGSWLSLGVAISGLLVDLVILAGYGASDGFLFDAAVQAGLVCVALRAREGTSTNSAADALTAGAHPRVGWTFALASA